MTFEQAETFRWNPFDLTKVWPYEEFPLKRVGKLVLNKNSLNYFAQVEQAAYAPSNMVPGIETSPDKMLQVRMFSYKDTQRHRIGANYRQLPINAAKSPVNTYNRDGPMEYVIPDEGPNYFPNSFKGPTISSRGMQSQFPLAGDVKRYNSKDEDNYSQPAIFWEKCVDNAGRRRLVDNLADSIQFATKSIQDRAVHNFSQVNKKFGEMLREALAKRNQA